MPLACDLLLKGIFLPTSRSRIPVVDCFVESVDHHLVQQEYAVDDSATYKDDTESITIAAKR